MVERMSVALREIMNFELMMVKVSGWQEGFYTSEHTADDGPDLMNGGDPEVGYWIRD